MADMAHPEDILALIRIVREQQAQLDKLKARLEESERVRENYQRWWLADSEELSKLRETLEAKSKEEPK